MFDRHAGFSATHMHPWLIPRVETAGFGQRCVCRQESLRLFGRTRLIDTALDEFAAHACEVCETAQALIFVGEVDEHEIEVENLDEAAVVRGECVRITDMFHHNRQGLCTQKTDDCLAPPGGDTDPCMRQADSIPTFKIGFCVASGEELVHPPCMCLLERLNPAFDQFCGFRIGFETLIKGRSEDRSMFGKHRRQTLEALAIARIVEMNELLEFLKDCDFLVHLFLLAVRFGRSGGTDFRVGFRVCIAPEKWRDEFVEFFGGDTRIASP